mmetsp:Transcript_9927/g.22565  ORF Transcript_9927/g.22565 Transcript_9927/m.22565 type:complete len:391 (+) Transcript_9927:133-1305(+)
MGLLESISRARGLLLIALSSVGFVFQTAIVHYIGDTICPAEQTGIRGLGALALIVLSLFFAIGRPSRAWYGSAEVWPWMLLRGVSGFCGNVLAFFALADAASIGDASALIFLSPLFTAIYAAVLIGEQPSRVVVIALLMGLFGAVLVARPSFLGYPGEEDAEGGTSVSHRSNLFALASAMAGGLVFVTLRRTKEEHFLAVMHWQMMGMSIGGFSVAYFTCGIEWRFEPEQIPMLIAYGILAFLAQVCMTTGARTQNAAASSGIRTLDVALTYGLQLVAFPQDAFNPESAFGAGLIMLGVMLLVLERILFPTPEEVAKEAKRLPQDEDDVREVETIVEPAKLSSKLPAVLGKRFDIPKAEELAHLEQHETEAEVTLKLEIVSSELDPELGA